MIFSLKKSHLLFWKNKRVFGSMVAVTIQSVFYLEMNQNDIFFYFKKIIFDISISK